MTSVLDQLQATLSGGTLDEIGRRIGAAPDGTKSAIDGALPVLLAALGREAGDPERRDGLRRAIEEDHDGSVVDDLMGYLSGQMGGRATNGEGILGHILGDRQQTAVQGLSARSGLDMGTIASLLPLLAPIVMGMIGKQQRGGGLSFDDLADVLGGDAQRAQASSPDLGDLLGGVLGGQAGGASTSGGRRSKGGLADILGSLFGKR